jgi:DNA-binding LytR/AlgR family response regulator
MKRASLTSLERRADRYSWAIVVIFTALSLLIEGTSEQMNIARYGLSEPGGVAAQWLLEISSHLALLFVTMIVPIWLNRFPVSLSTWRRRIPHYVVAFLILSIGHVLLMVAVRQAVWPIIAEGQYEFGLLRFEPWAYEMRKDFMSFLSLLGIFIASRHIFALDEERRAAREDAQTTGQLTLKSGGRQILVPADQVVYASAAGNYVEIHTASGRHFVRLTLSELANLLGQAGAQPVRLHCSHLTVRAHLREIGPTGALLSSGVRLPVGRSYRAALS